LPKPYSENGIKLDGVSYIPPSSKGKPEARPYGLPPPLPSLLPLPPLKEEKKPQPEKKPEGKPYAAPAPKEDKATKPYDKPKSYEKPQPPPPPPKPYSQEKAGQDKQKDQGYKKDDAKNGCIGGKCRRGDPTVPFDNPPVRSLVSNLPSGLPPAQRLPQYIGSIGEARATMSRVSLFEPCLLLY
jgi:hypothetical protein